MHRIPRALVLTLAALALPAAAQAQFGIGVKLGANLAKLSDLESAIASGTKADFAGGGYFSIGHRVTFQPEILYSRRSTALTTTGGSGTVKQNFIEIPLLVGFRLIPDGVVQPEIYAGPSLSFETACKIDGASGVFTATTGECASLFGSTDTKSTVFAGVAGAAVRFVLGGVVLSADARYNYGLSKVLDTGSDAKWRYFSVLAGVGVMIR